MILNYINLLIFYHKIRLLMINIQMSKLKLLCTLLAKRLLLWSVRRMVVSIPFNFSFIAHIFARKEDQFRIRKKVFREEKFALNFLNKFKVQKLIK